MTWYFCLSILSLSAFSSTLETEKFQAKWLENPHRFIQELENCFEYVEIGQYYPQENDEATFLYNSYAKSGFDHFNSTAIDIKAEEVHRIDLVFTKYPYDKKDWITNYHLLMANRLIKLFELKPELNRTDVLYRLVIQTDCKTEEEAKLLPHGFQIVFGKRIKTNNNDYYQDISQRSETKLDQGKVEKVNLPKKPAERNEDKYRYDYRLPEPIPFKKEESKKKKKLDCPDFSQKKKFKWR